MSLDLFRVFLLLPDVRIVVDSLGAFDGADVGTVVLRVYVFQVRVEVLLGRSATKGTTAGGVSGASSWRGSGGDDGLTVHYRCCLFGEGFWVFLHRSRARSFEKGERDDTRAVKG